MLEKIPKLRRQESGTWHDGSGGYFLLETLADLIESRANTMRRTAAILWEKAEKFKAEQKAWPLGAERTNRNLTQIRIIKPNNCAPIAVKIQED